MYNVFSASFPESIVETSFLNNIHQA